jgi:hypothetical protein
MAKKSRASAAGIVIKILVGLVVAVVLVLLLQPQSSSSEPEVELRKRLYERGVRPPPLYHNLLRWLPQQLQSKFHFRPVCLKYTGSEVGESAARDVIERSLLKWYRVHKEILIPEARFVIPAEEANEFGTSVCPLNWQKCSRDLLWDSKCWSERVRKSLPVAMVICLNDYSSHMWRPNLQTVRDCVNCSRQQPEHDHLILSLTREGSFENYRNTPR